MSEAEFITFVKNQLRGASWKWACISNTLRKARVARGIYLCNHCKLNCPSSIIKNNKRVKNVHVNHIKSVVSVFEGFTTWDDFIDRLFCEEIDLEVLCSECHDNYTNFEKELRKDYMNYSLEHPKEYEVWRSMYRRCLEPKNKKYHLYGGRGIDVCDEWNPYKSPKQAFKNFLHDMGQRPENLTLERLDSNKGYNKLNCVWATYEQQNNNRPSYNHYITYNGEVKTLSQWAHLKGIKVTTLDERLKRGWDFERAILTPVRSVIKEK